MQPWYELSEARLIIQSCAHRLPKRVGHVEQYTLTRDEWTTYEGLRVDRLRAIRSQHLGTALVQADRMTDRAAASRWMREAGIMIEVEDAIDAAVEVRAVMARVA